MTKFFATLFVLVLLGGFNLFAQAHPSSSRSSQRVESSRPAPTRPPATSTTHYAQPQHRSSYRNGGYYGGYYGGNGYYRTRSFYGFGYGYGYSGYGYGGYYPQMVTGIKFNLDLVDKKDRKAVERGIVSVGGSEFGIVDRFDSWQNAAISLPAGNHQVTIELEDGRIFQTEVSIGEGQVRHVYLRFEKKP